MPRPKGGKRKINKAKFSRALARGMSNTAAAIHAGHPVHRAGQAGYEMAKDPDVRAQVAAALDRAGARLAKSALRIAQAHNATTIKAWHDGQGGVVESREYVDHDTRLRAAELNLRLRGALDAPGDAGQAGQMRVDILLGSGASSEERAKFGDVLAAIRITRGLHPSSDRPLVPGEI